MPVTKSAAKALRRDRRRQTVNLTLRARVRNILAKVKAEPNRLPEAYSILDQAAQKGIIHPNKAARLKSGLSHAVTPPAIPAPVAPAKKAPKTKKTPKK